MVLTEKQRDTYETLLGIFAGDIRNDWGSGVHDRITYMREIMIILDFDYEIDEERCAEDGRWMRDSWTGPYLDWAYEDDEPSWYKERDMEIFDLYYDRIRYPSKGLEKAIATYRSKK